MKNTIIFKAAQYEDLNELEKLENSCFTSDKLSLANFKYFLTKANAQMMVAKIQNEVLGYGIILFHRNTSLSRLYSLAVLPTFSGRGIGHSLLERLEKKAIDRNCTYLRLEVNVNNSNAIKLYKGMGYKLFKLKHDYYEDRSDALCLEKKISKLKIKNRQINVPYYRQTTDFTCGPASLIMSLKALVPEVKYRQIDELDIWREATTIFMLTGHGGCGPHGLALAAKKRGLSPSIYLSSRKSLFVSSVRNQEKKKIIEVVQNNFEQHIKDERIPIQYQAFKWSDLTETIDNGGVVLVLISSYRLTGHKAPHWIVITGHQDDFVFFHDPYFEKDDSLVDVTNIPIRKDEFEKLVRYGSKQLQCYMTLRRTKKGK